METGRDDGEADNPEKKKVERKQKYNLVEVLLYFPGTSFLVLNRSIGILPVPSSSLQASAILQVKVTLIYFANFHKHTKTRRAHLHMESCMCADSRRVYEYSGMTLTVKSVCSSDDVTPVENTHPRPVCTHKPVCPVIMSQALTNSQQ